VGLEQNKTFTENNSKGGDAQCVAAVTDTMGIVKYHESWYLIIF